MSLSGNGRSINDGDYAGHVAPRVKADSKSKGEKSIPLSWASDDGQQVPIHSQFENGSTNSYIRSPPRPGSQKSSQRHRETTSSRASSIDGDFSKPTEIPKEDSSFKSWLSSGILGALNAAAGVTLSTTGQLIAPSLHMTKTVLLPGLLALFIDTLDATAPERVKDWFRILSSSVHHLVSVVGSTESGQQFSNKFFVVLQELIRALSSPETMQVLVDGMASGVKLADALNTPEVHAWMDHVILLGCRLVDAAASGKTKQLLHDAKDLAWSGIEMASDPAATLAFAEVTAHLCYALEDAHHSMEPNKRALRNAQNQATYVDALQMSDLPNQVSIERVILSSLGKFEKGDWGVEENIPSSVVCDEEERSMTANQDRDLKDRGERVDGQFLKDRIYHPSQIRSRKNSQSSAVSAGKSSESSATPTLDSLPNIPPRNLYSDFADSEQKESEREISDNHGKHSTRKDDMIGKAKEDEDMEDFVCEKLPSSGRTPERQSRHLQNHSQDKSTKEPGVHQFYRLLDGFLEKNREVLEKNRENRERSQHDARTAVEDSKKPESDGETRKSWMLLHAKVKKLKEGTIERKVERVRKKQRSRFRQFPKHQQLCILIAGAAALFFVLCWIGFGLYGMYTFARFRVAPKKMPTNTPTAFAPPLKGNSELVIRLIREVVHVREDGTVIESEPESSFSNTDIDAVADCVASHFQNEP